MVFGKKGKMGYRWPTKKVKVAAEKDAEEGAVSLPDYYECHEDDDGSFEFNHDDNTVDDPQDLLEFLEERSEPFLKEDCFRKAIAFLFVTPSIIQSRINVHGAGEMKSARRFETDSVSICTRN
jgi:hypothetical protein